MITVNSEIVFHNEIKAKVVEVFQNGSYVIEPQFPPKTIIPFGATRMTINPGTNQPYGYEPSIHWTVVKVNFAKEEHKLGASCPWPKKKK